MVLSRHHHDQTRLPIPTSDLPLPTSYFLTHLRSAHRVLIHSHLLSDLAGRLSVGAATLHVLHVPLGRRGRLARPARVSRKQCVVRRLECADTLLLHLTSTSASSVLTSY